jgi:SNF2 family DNA or RNA helicase
VQLRQSCIYAKNEQGVIFSTKSDWVVDFLTQEENIKKKFLIFCMWKEPLAILQKALDDVNLATHVYNGTMSAHDKSTAISAFDEEPEVRGLIMQTLCGGVGLNLTAAEIVIHMGPEWNPCNELQATGRCWRRGQEKDVTNIKLIMNNTVEMHCRSVQVCNNITYTIV